MFKPNVYNIPYPVMAFSFVCAFSAETSVSEEILCQIQRH